MATTLDCALLAGSAYFDTRTGINRFPTPSGWNLLSKMPAQTSGFEASIFGNGADFVSSTEIVISYAGTYDKDVSGDIAADANLAQGVYTNQLLQAARYYLDVQAANPGATITLTGHSLGGGLASLIAVFFNKDAVTFDQGPFANSARSFNGHDAAATLLDQLKSLSDPNNKPYDLSGLTSFIEQRQTSGSSIPNAGNVRNIIVAGEMLSVSPGNWLDRIGTTSSADTISNTATGASSGDLHSQALLTAFLQSQASNADQSLNKVTDKLPDLLKLMFDATLFAHRTDEADDGDHKNLIEHLVRHEAGVSGSITPDAMVTRFTSDLWKLAQDGGLTMNDGNPNGPTLAEVSQALIAFAMQKYYEEKTSSAGYNKELFKTETGGISFTMSDVAASWSDTKGKQFFDAYLAQSSNGLSQAERETIAAQIANMEQWFVQAGANGMNATAESKAAFMLGGKGSDALTGGSAADLLVGNQGNDVLKGGGGSDILLGGTGFDTYIQTTGDGADKLLDTDASGRIILNHATEKNAGTSASIFIGVAGQPNTWKTADGKLTLTHNDSWSLSFDGGSMDLGTTLNQGDLGLHWMSAPAEPATTNDIKGDFKLADVRPDLEGEQWDTDPLGNYLVSNTAEPNRVDTLYDSAGNDHISSGGGNDVIYTTRGGSNLVEAGTGRDWVYGGAGVDVVAGGAEGDILQGGAGNDRVYADTVVSTEVAIANGNSQANGAQKGDWLNGNEGDDILVGSANDDVLFGGGGADVLIGGAGNDLIGGDIDWGTASLNWSYVNGRVGPIVGVENAPDYGDDVIHGGAGNDYIFAGRGNDALHGDAGTDTLVGGEDNDALFGGAGNDDLYGDYSDATALAGADYLDGGEGSDRLYGGGGNDYLVVGQNDQAEGGSGDDFYEINGNGTIKDTSGHNNYRINASGVTSVKLSDLSMGASSIEVINSPVSGQPPKLSVTANGDQQIQIGGLTISGEGWMNGSLQEISVDGAVYSARQLLQSSTSAINTDVTRSNYEVFTGVAADNIGIYGAGNTVFAGKGNDSIGVSASNTTVKFSAGDGRDQVNLFNGAMAATGTPLTIALEDGFDFTQLRMGRLSGNAVALYLSPAGNESISIQTVGADVEQAMSRLVVTSGTQSTTLAALLQAGQEFAGNDDTNFLFSFNKPTTLTGQGGDDYLTGSSFDDVLDGGTGNDELRAGLGNDTYLWGRGYGNDTIEDTGGVDVLQLINLQDTDVDVRKDNSGALVFTVRDTGEKLNVPYYFSEYEPQARIESIVFSNGVQWSFDSVRAQTLIGTSGNDRIVGFDDADNLRGGLGNDDLDGRGGDDVLDGGDGDDYLRGGAGNDRLIGGAGNDSLGADGGDDTYVWGLGAGNDSIYDWGGALDTLELSGLTAQDITAVRYNGGEAVVSIKATGETLDIVQNFYARDSYMYTVERFVFADGTVWDIQAQSRNFVLSEWFYDDGTSSNPVLTGWDLADYIVGGKSNNSIDGLQGDDVLEGGEGDDILIGGADNDTLTGGAGNDVYQFSLGDGHDVIADADKTVGKVDTLRFDGSIGVASLTVSRNGNDMLLSLTGGVDSVTVKDWFDGTNFSKLEVIEFADGSSFSAADLEQMLPVQNHAPQVTQSVEQQLANAGTAWNFSLPQGTFIDADGDVLVYGATAADGSTLPAWLSFNPQTRSFSGLPNGANVGDVSIVVTATDAHGGAATLNFMLSVAGVDPLGGNDTLYADTNNTPVVGGAGNDTLYGSWNSSTLIGGTGNDTLIAQGGPNNVLDGGAGDDTLIGSWGQDTLTGGEGNNTIMALGGDSLISAGAGNDTIASNWGNDIVYAGAGNDTISTGWGADSIDAGAGDDTISAGGGGDVIRGGLGNDQISNTQWSDDKYQFAAGDGQDTVLDAGGQDQLVLESLYADQLWFAHTGNDLNISVIGTTDSVTLKDWYSGYQYPGSQYHVEQFKSSDGKTLLDSQVQNLVSAMAAFAPPAAGQTTLPANYAANLQPVLAANWQ